jgi:hypothetical protein
MADWCAKQGLDPIFIDNHSDYTPLIRYYLNCPYEVYRMKENYGHTVLWNKEIALFKSLVGNERYIVTDPDLDLEGIPDDFLKVLNAGLDKYPQFNKCGFSLEINDLPNTPEGNLIRTKVEPRYWRRLLDPLYYNAPIDTTFALYREGVNTYFHPAIRTNRPYTARHIPWYYYHFSELPEDEQYYFKTANSSSSGKNRLVP